MTADYDRIRDPRRREHYVYRLLASRGRTLYIGCSMNLELRLKDHARGEHGKWWANVRTEGPFDYFTARRIERELIRSEQPPHNREYRLGFRRGRPDYEQPRRLRTSPLEAAAR